ncbi:hypothetical protein [Streptomyces xiaopingdaonensis]|uniref:hypothetical protein n=1 Tax=Streptomyces xiaopingdaonensis TaxID=1565415 RepID=UPI000309F950|nr:hypothetical protein [Streptomyces xiaopingdaonensis]
MDNIAWEDPYCGAGVNCFRLGTDEDGNAYIAVAGEEQNALSDTREALRSLILEIKAGKADHLL